MRKIYLDHSSTSFPKFPDVAKAMAEFIQSGAYNIGRGHYEGAEQAAMRIMRIRQMIAGFFGFDNFRNVIFTQNITHSLNLVLKGLLRDGDHVLCTSMEHNAVMRPLTQLTRHGVTFTAVSCDTTGMLDPARLEAAVKPATKAVVITCASNVCGTIMPIADVAEICRRRDLFLILDSAQYAGHLPVDLSAVPCDAFCFTGHKALQGPQGIGGVLLSERIAAEIDPLISGGTGSFSDSEEVPRSLPDRFEAGTQNLPGIIGLGAAIETLKARDLIADYRHELSLTEYFLAGLAEHLSASTYRPVGLPTAAGRVGVVSLDFPGKDNGEIAWLLESRHGIMTRSGLHCAPRAHQTLGTFPQGTVRFSFGRDTTTEDLDEALAALHELL